MHQTRPRAPLCLHIRSRRHRRLTKDDITDHTWLVSEILESETFAGLGVEAIVTADGGWHEPEHPGQLWDDPAWLEKARHVLEQHQECVILRHVLHI